VGAFFDLAATSPLFFVAGAIASAVGVLMLVWRLIR
jgi:hypothetical protein